MTGLVDHQAKLAELLSDPVKRLNTIYTIVDKNSKRIPFRQNAIQAAISACTANRKAILKARQFGVSTGCIIALFDDTIWNRDRTNVILAHEQDAIKKLFRIVRRAYEFLDPELKPEVTRGGGSKYEMFFPGTNSIIYCDMESRGDTINNLHISEAAFADKEKIDATMQAVPLGGKVTFETTPNGIGNWFYDYWAAENTTKKLFFPWFYHNEYAIPTDVAIELTADERRFVELAKSSFGIDISESQINYRRYKQEEFSQVGGLSFMQEYPEDDQTCFLSSGNPAIDLQLIADLRRDRPQAVFDTVNLKIFEQPDIKKFYVIGADVAEGVGGDFSVAIVMDVFTRREVAILRGQFKPGEFAHKLAALGVRYKTRMLPLIAVERNNHGHAVLLELERHVEVEGHKGYPCIYRAADDRLGWKTDKITRPKMIDILIQGIENRTVTFVSDYFLTECLTLVNNEGKIEAAAGKKDDCIIAGAITLSMAIDKQTNLDAYTDILGKVRI